MASRGKVGNGARAQNLSVKVGYIQDQQIIIGIMVTATAVPEPVLPVDVNQKETTSPTYQNRYFQEVVTNRAIQSNVSTAI